MDRYTTTEYGKQNMFAHEPQIQVDVDHDYWKNAELLNGRLAMIGFFAAVHNYILFGAVMPGIFWCEQVSINSIPITNLRTMTPEAEKFNGWMAMLGIVAALGAYSFTGQIIPGVF